MPQNRLDPEKLRAFFAAQVRGAGFMAACIETGTNPATMEKYQAALQGEGEPWRVKAVKYAIEAFPDRGSWGEEKLAKAVDDDGPVNVLDPIPRHKLSTEAINALDNIELFAERYFGIMLAPWQQQAAAQIVKLLNSEEKEYACINVAPGTGKTMFFTLIIPAWLICRDRTIRGMTGHASANISKQEVDNLRRVLQRDIPMRATDTDLKLGIGKDAVATLAEDYGRFKPLPSENAPWRAEYFSVAQMGGIPLGEKEYTWTAIGYNSIFIGTRVNFAIWDDADSAKARSELTRDEIFRTWDQVAEQRIEPGGLLVIQGQRLGGDDLYRHVIDKKKVPDDIDDEWDSDDDITHYDPLYHHIVYKAHYEELCKGKATHKRTSKAWPEGCLLFPSRVSWRQLQQIKLNNPRDYEVLYQQEDVDQKHVLVRQIWVDGGIDPDTKEEYIGCWDYDRHLCEWPHGLSKPYFSIATVDPSPSNFWACLAEGTSVTTLMGEKPIERVTTDDRVLTREGWRRVVWHGSRGVKEVIDLHLSNGRTLTVTPDHRILTKSGWVEAGNLLPGTMLVSGYGGARPAVSTPVINSEVRTREFMSSFAVGGADNSLHVLGVGFIDNAVKSDTQPLTTGVTSLEFDRLAPRFDPQCQPMRQPLSVGVVPVDLPIGAAARGLGSPGPNQATVLIDHRPVPQKPLVKGGSLHSGGLNPVSAGLAGFGVRSDGLPAVTEVHLVSVTHPSITRQVFDLTVEGELPEFTAEGVIVHNCQWWLFHPSSGQRFLLDLIASPLTAPEVLDWNVNKNDWTGILEDWQNRSKFLGAPITHWIIEANAAQKFILQYEHVKRWRQKHGVSIIPHQTNVNKSDPDYGVWSIGPHWRFGRVRLPAAGNSKITVQRLVNEVTRYPDSRYDDQVMASWFMEWNLPKLTMVQAENIIQSRPSWSDRLGGRLLVRR